MSGLDAAWLTFETSTAHLHVGMAAVLEPGGSAGGDGQRFADVRRLIAARIDDIPAFRRRVVPVPFGLHRPVWVEDPTFDLDLHLRRSALPAPGATEELAEFAADVISRPLDRSRPLWLLHVVEGLEGGRVAVVAKTHHAAIDGVSGAELMGTLLDTSPDAPIGEPVTVTGEPVPSDLRLVAEAGLELAMDPLRLLRTATRTARAAARVGTKLLRPSSSGPDPTTADAESQRSDPPPAPFSAPRSVLNGAISPHRSVSFTSVPLDRVKDLKDAFGVKLNDVVLAACGGALRSWLRRRGELPEDPLVAFVPISVRGKGGGSGANQISAMLSSLATDTSDPVERLRRIAGGTSGGKRQHDAIGATTLTDWTRFAAPAVFSLAAQMYTRTRLADRHRPMFNTVISNVPGPQHPLYLAGMRLTDLYPMGPIIEGGALNITVMSYAGQLSWGLVGDRELLGDLDDLAGDLHDAIAALEKAVDTS